MKNLILFVVVFILAQSQANAQPPPPPGGGPGGQLVDAYCAFNSVMYCGKITYGGHDYHKFICELQFSTKDIPTSARPAVFAIVGTNGSGNEVPGETSGTVTVQFLQPWEDWDGETPILFESKIMTLNPPPAIEIQGSSYTYYPGPEI